MFGLAHRAVLLAPAKDAFDHRPARLRHAIALVPRGASVDGAPTTLAGCGDAVVLYHMRCNVDGAQMGHMVSRVISLIFAHRDAAAGLLGFGLEHDLRRAALGSAIGERDHAGHRQPISVLHGGVAHVAELRLAPGGLAVKTAIGIAGARMRVILNHTVEPRLFEPKSLLPGNGILPAETKAPKRLRKTKETIAE